MVNVNYYRSSDQDSVIQAITDLGVSFTEYHRHVFGGSKEDMANYLGITLPTLSNLLAGRFTGLATRTLFDMIEGIGINSGTTDLPARIIQQVEDAVCVGSTLRNRSGKMTTRYVSQPKDKHHHSPSAIAKIANELIERDKRGEKIKIKTYDKGVSEQRILQLGQIFNHFQLTVLNGKKEKLGLFLEVSYPTLQKILSGQFGGLSTETLFKTIVFVGNHCQQPDLLYDSMTHVHKAVQQGKFFCFEQNQGPLQEAAHRGRKKKIGLEP